MSNSTEPNTDSQSPPIKDERKPYGGELILPIIALAFTLYYFSTIIDSPWTAQVNAFFVGSLLLAFITLFIVKIGVECYQGTANLKLGNLLQPYPLLMTRVYYIVLIIGYLIAIEYGLGFTISTFLFLSGGMVLLNKGKKIRFSLMLSVCLSLIGYVVFIVAFKTRFPAGPFEKIMKLIIEGGL